jgi:hypothetical protein
LSTIMDLQMCVSWVVLKYNNFSILLSLSYISTHI